MHTFLRGLVLVSDGLKSLKLTVSRMPRKPTSNVAISSARFFLDNFIERTDNADHILPKNDIYSPFAGFCRVFPQVRAYLQVQSRRCISSHRMIYVFYLKLQFAKKKDGGTSSDGVSRAAFNKICLEFFVSNSLFRFSKCKCNRTF